MGPRVAEDTVYQELRREYDAAREAYYREIPSESVRNLVQDYKKAKDRRNLAESEMKLAQRFCSKCSAYDNRNTRIYDTRRKADKDLYKITDALWIVCSHPANEDFKKFTLGLGTQKISCLGHEKTREIILDPAFPIDHPAFSNAASKLRNAGINDIKQKIQEYRILAEEVSYNQDCFRDAGHAVEAASSRCDEAHNLYNAARSRFYKEMGFRADLGFERYNRFLNAKNMFEHYQSMAKLRASSNYINEFTKKPTAA
jgi:hypothetical protein